MENTIKDTLKSFYNGIQGNFFKDVVRHIEYLEKKPPNICNICKKNYSDCQAKFRVVNREEILCGNNYVIDCSDFEKIPLEIFDTEF